MGVGNKDGGEVAFSTVSENNFILKVFLIGICPYVYRGVSPLVLSLSCPLSRNPSCDPEKQMLDDFPFHLESHFPLFPCCEYIRENYSLSLSPCISLDAYVRKHEDVCVHKCL